MANNLLEEKLTGMNFLLAEVDRKCIKKKPNILVTGLFAYWRHIPIKYTKGCLAYRDQSAASKQNTPNIWLYSNVLLKLGNWFKG